MRQIPTEEAVGQVLCHDMTQIVTDPDKPRYKGPRFKKGHVVREEDIPVLLSMGKRSLYVLELEPGQLHENDAAERLAALIEGPGVRRKNDVPSEGKIDLVADTDGCLLVDSERLIAVNSVDDVMIATRQGNIAIKAGDDVAGTRVIPLVVGEDVLEKAEAAAGDEPLLTVRPFALKRAAIMATGSEVASGLIEDRFTPVIARKLETYGIETVMTAQPGDDQDALVACLQEMRDSGDVDFIVCTGGMSVDPDDNTPGAIKASGAKIVTYGAPVLPGAMMLMGYYEGVYGPNDPCTAPGLPVVGLPGCAMYNDATVFDLVLPRIVAGVELTKRDFVVLGEGGLCLRCKTCTYPHCPFGK